MVILSYVLFVLAIGIVILNWFFWFKNNSLRTWEVYQRVSTMPLVPQIYLIIAYLLDTQTPIPIIYFFLIGVLDIGLLQLILGLFKSIKVRK